MSKPQLALLLALCITSLQAQTKPTTPRPLPKPNAETPAAQLPVTRVSLYKNGVGFFEHAGRVTGNQSITIDFTSAQLNDVLQSLTAIDLNGGRISGAAYNSTTPLEQQLKALPLALTEDPTSADLYNAIRGARVEISGSGATITGRLLNLEIVSPSNPDSDSTSSKAAFSKRLITVMSDSGSVRSVELTSNTSVRLLDPALQTDVNRYLQLLANNRSQGLRHLTLQDIGPVGGPATRELRVSYISEVPIWKSTYRILFTDPKSPTTTQTATLQGWSVIDNTTGSDWLNVQLSLIAGAPQSFIQPLSQPIYSRRPEIPIAQAAQLTPQTFASADTQGQSSITGRITDATGATIPNAIVIATNPSTGAQVTRTSGSDGTFAIPLSNPGQYRLQVTSPGFQSLVQNVAVAEGRDVNINPQLNIGSASSTIEVSSASVSSLPINGRNRPLAKSPARISSGIAGGVMGGFGAAPPPPLDYAEVAQASLTPNTTTSTFDDFFEYKLTDPVTIRKNESALVPILQTKIDSERVSLWSPRQPTPLRALWITNTSNLTLDRGSFAIVENGSFGGEGLLDPIHPNERRLLSYAADQAIRVTPANTNSTHRVERITIHFGVLTQTTLDIGQFDYLVHNAAPEARTVVIEQPVRNGWTLDDTGATPESPKPTETTPTANRFRIAVAPNQTSTLHITERHPGSTGIMLTNTPQDQLVIILRNANASQALLQQLEPVFAAQRALAELERQIKTKEDQVEAITDDQDRLRENMKALKGSTEERALTTRYTTELNQQEDKLATLRKELETLNQQQAAANTDLSNKIQSLNIDEKV